MPRHMTWPIYICEGCQVRSILGRDLSALRPTDIALMMLERMRQIDQAGYWAQSTLAQYYSNVNILRKFENWSGAPISSLPTITRPPVSQSISIQWAHLRHTVHRRKDGNIGIKFQSARSLRSAAHFLYTIGLQTVLPDNIISDDNGFDYRHPVAPTATLNYKLLAKGMVRRMGDSANPSWAISHIHVKYIDWALELAFLAAAPPRQHDIACAAALNLIGYLGWLRSAEAFSLRYDDVTLTPPHSGERRGLPPAMGAVELRLLPETKSSPSRTADVVLAWRTGSGLCLGRWMERLQLYNDDTEGQPLFSTLATPEWTSHHFRTAFVFPLLEQQRLSGEPTLQAFTEVVGQRLCDKIWSYNTWRRAGRSRVSRGPRHNEPRFPGMRMATKVEIYEHARWALPPVDMPARYNQWDLLDRLMINVLCT